MGQFCRADVDHLARATTASAGVGIEITFWDESGTPIGTFDGGGIGVGGFVGGGKGE